jgi:predicted extracellular nuclease
MTLNCFNLDPHIEAEEKVMNPRQDIDDDWGEGRFHTLAQAIALQANTPDIVALQEIQDNDGAELTVVVDASRTDELRIRTVAELSGLAYAWVDVNPELGADGGQPGGNIRNAYLYNPKRVKIIPEKTKACGRDNPAFEGSRKPLLVVFEELSSHKQLACINVHLASKRHQNSIFAPLNPGVDEKLAVRVAQASHVADELELLRQQKLNYYVTGDFNDTEHSETLKTLIGNHSANLVMSLPEEERYDYNHRGKLQVLMHGVIPIDRQDNADYEIIHGNELIGVTPGEESDKPSDHAYVIAKLKL